MNLAVLQFREGLLHEIEGASRDFSGGAPREYYFSVRIGHVESLLEPGILHFECGGIQSFEYSEPVVDLGQFQIEEISGRLDRKSTSLNSSHQCSSRMPYSA